MEKVIVYVDNAAYAQQVLASLLTGGNHSNTHWVLVACAPRMTYRVSKWVSHSTRENWRAKWADKLFAQILPALHLPAGRVTTMLAKGPLTELTDQLQADGMPVAQVMDARRPRTDGPDAPAGLSDAAEARTHNPWSPFTGTLGSVLTGFGAMWMLALD